MKKEKLKEWRKEKGYSQADLAKALDVAVMTISRWETGTRSIPPFLHLALRCLELEGDRFLLKGQKKGRKEK